MDWDNSRSDDCTNNLDLSRLEEIIILPNNEENINFITYEIANIFKMSSVQTFPLIIVRVNQAKVKYKRSRSSLSE